MGDIAFHHCGKTDEENNLRGETFVGFKGFGPWQLTPLFLGLRQGCSSSQKLVAKQNCSLHVGHESERESEGIGQDAPSNGIAPVICDQAPPPIVDTMLSSVAYLLIKLVHS